MFGQSKYRMKKTSYWMEDRGFTKNPLNQLPYRLKKSLKSKDELSSPGLSNHISVNVHVDGVLSQSARLLTVLKNDVPFL